MSSLITDTKAGCFYSKTFVFQNYAQYTYNYFCSLFLCFSSYFACSSGVMRLIRSLSYLADSLLTSAYFSLFSASCFYFAAALMAFLAFSHFARTVDDMLSFVMLSTSNRIVLMILTCVSKPCLFDLSCGKVIWALKNNL